MCEEINKGQKTTLLKVLIEIQTGIKKKKEEIDNNINIYVKNKFGIKIKKTLDAPKA